MRRARLVLTAAALAVAAVAPPLQPEGAPPLSGHSRHAHRSQRPSHSSVRRHHSGRRRSGRISPRMERGGEDPTKGPTKSGGPLGDLLSKAKAGMDQVSQQADQLKKEADKKIATVRSTDLSQLSGQLSDKVSVVGGQVGKSVSDASQEVAKVTGGGGPQSTGVDSSTKDEPGKIEQTPSDGGARTSAQTSGTDTVQENVQLLSPDKKRVLRELLMQELHDPALHEQTSTVQEATSTATTNTDPVPLSGSTTPETDPTLKTEDTAGTTGSTTNAGNV